MPASKQLIAQKIESTLQKQWQEPIATEQDFCQLLGRLQYTTNSYGSWDELSHSAYTLLRESDGSVPIQNVLMFCYAIEGMPSQDSQASPLWTRHFKEFATVRKLQKQYEQFRRCQREQRSLQRTQASSSRGRKHFYSPEISAKSQTLAQNQRQELQGGQSLDFVSLLAMRDQKRVSKL